MEKVDIKKYAHLKFHVFDAHYKYVLFEDSNALVDSISRLLEESNGLPFATFFSKDEYSAVIPDFVKVNSLPTKDVRGWTCIRIVGEMPFGTVQGLIANIAKALMDINVGVCVVSSYKTDFFFVKKDNYEIARTALVSQGWQFI